jgi:hypothetical protein
VLVAIGRVHQAEVAGVGQAEEAAMLDALGRVSQVKVGLVSVDPTVGAARLDPLALAPHVVLGVLDHAAPAREREEGREGGREGGGRNEHTSKDVSLSSFSLPLQSCW